MRTNIWIRKHNEKFWEMVEDKSAFVNRAIEHQKTQKSTTVPLHKTKESFKRGE